MQPILLHRGHTFAFHTTCMSLVKTSSSSSPPKNLHVTSRERASAHEKWLQNVEHITTLCISVVVTLLLMTTGNDLSMCCAYFVKYSIIKVQRQICIYLNH